MSSNIANDNVILRDSLEVINIKTNTENEKKTNFKERIYNVVKRGMDIIGSLVGIVLLVPITIVIWIGRLILKENDGPLFYEQLRIGKNGKQFRLYKYRSMVMDADKKLAEYLKENEEARKEYKKYKKLRCDPRITKVGKVLRATSLDEFPQFINVLKGDMSLVGPRPYLPREQKEMGEYYIGITKVKPGITGPWQIKGRSKITFEDRLKMDFEYTNKSSLLRDAKILVKTFTKVIDKDGAI